MQTVENESLGEFPSVYIILTTVLIDPLKSPYCTLRFVVSMTFAPLARYNVRTKPPALSLDEDLECKPVNTALIFAMGCCLFNSCSFCLL